LIKWQSDEMALRAEFGPWAQVWRSHFAVFRLKQTLFKQYYALQYTFLKIYFSSICFRQVFSDLHKINDMRQNKAYMTTK